MVKKVKVKPSGPPKMFISDKPAKPKKTKRQSNANSGIRASFTTTSRDIADHKKQKRSPIVEVELQALTKRDTSKSKPKPGKKKKKLKRESSNTKSEDRFKPGLIQASKFSTFDLQKSRNLDSIPVDEDEVKRNQDLDDDEEEDHVLLGRIYNIVKFVLMFI